MQERTHHRYVYNGSALIAEIDATTRQVLRTFAWGATGELLMINDRADTLGPQTYLPVRDAAGSVTGIMRAVDNTFAATYEYDPNGNLLRASGEYAKSNPFTWGGGWMDWETGLINAGSLYYSARLGRFINTAPSGGGDGLPACYGVAPTAGHLSSRAYAQPPARRSTGAAGWISVDPDAWVAYEKARAPALAAHEAALDEYQRSNRGGVPIEDYSAAEFVADFLAWAFGQYFTGTHGSFDTGLSDNYGNYAFDGSKMKYKDGERPGYFDANSDEWVYPDGTRVSFSVEFKEMTALAYQISAGGGWYDWNTSAPVSGARQSTINIGSGSPKDEFPYANTTDADCGISAIRTVETLLTGKPARSRATIIDLLGEPAGTFDNNGRGMTRVRANLNAAFKPLGYQSTPAINTKNSAEYVALISKGEILVIEGKGILGGPHIMVIQPIAPEYNTVNVYNRGYTTPSGHAMVMTMSASDAASLPNQLRGESNSTWSVRPIPPPSKQ